MNLLKSTILIDNPSTINSLLQEEKKVQLVPETLKEQINFVADYLKFDQHRVVTEALIIGLKGVREKHQIPEAH